MMSTESPQQSYSRSEWARLSIQDRIRAMNKSLESADQSPVLKVNSDPATDDSTAASTLDDPSRSEDDIEANLIKRSSVVDIWRKRESSQQRDQLPSPVPSPRRSLPAQNLRKDLDKTTPKSGATRTAQTDSPTPMDYLEVGPTNSGVSNFSHPVVAYPSALPYETRSHGSPYSKPPNENPFAAQLSKPRPASLSVPSSTNEPVDLVIVEDDQSSSGRGRLTPRGSRVLEIWEKRNATHGEQTERINAVTPPLSSKEPTRSTAKEIWKRREDGIVSASPASLGSTSLSSSGLTSPRLPSSRLQSPKTPSEGKSWSSAEQSPRTPSKDKFWSSAQQSPKTPSEGKFWTSVEQDMISPLKKENDVIDNDDVENCHLQKASESLGHLEVEKGAAVSSEKRRMSVVDRWKRGMIYSDSFSPSDTSGSEPGPCKLFPIATKRGQDPTKAIEKSMTDADGNTNKRALFENRNAMTRQIFNSSNSPSSISTRKTTRDNAAKTSSCPSEVAGSARHEWQQQEVLLPSVKLDYDESVAALESARLHQDTQKNDNNALISPRSSPTNHSEEGLQKRTEVSDESDGDRPNDDNMDYMLYDPPSRSWGARVKDRQATGDHEPIVSALVKRWPAVVSPHNFDARADDEKCLNFDLNCDNELSSSHVGEVQDPLHNHEAAGSSSTSYEMKEDIMAEISKNSCVNDKHKSIQARAAVFERQYEKKDMQMLSILSETSTISEDTYKDHKLAGGALLGNTSFSSNARQHKSLSIEVPQYNECGMYDEVHNERDSEMYDNMDHDVDCDINDGVDGDMNDDEVGGDMNHGIKDEMVESRKDEVENQFDHDMTNGMDSEKMKESLDSLGSRDGEAENERTDESDDSEEESSDRGSDNTTKSPSMPSSPFNRATNALGRYKGKSRETLLERKKKIHAYNYQKILETRQTVETPDGTAVEGENAIDTIDSIEELSREQSDEELDSVNDESLEQADVENGIQIAKENVRSLSLGEGLVSEYTALEMSDSTSVLPVCDCNVSTGNSVSTQRQLRLPPSTENDTFTGSAHLESGNEFFSGATSAFSGYTAKAAGVFPHAPHVASQNAETSESKDDDMSEDLQDIPAMPPPLEDSYIYDPVDDNSKSIDTARDAGMITGSLHSISDGQERVGLTSRYTETSRFLDVEGKSDFLESGNSTQASQSFESKSCASDGGDSDSYDSLFETEPYRPRKPKRSYGPSPTRRKKMRGEPPSVEPLTPNDIAEACHTMTELLNLNTVASNISLDFKRMATDLNETIRQFVGEDDPSPKKSRRRKGSRRRATVSCDEGTSIEVEYMSTTSESGSSKEHEPQPVMSRGKEKEYAAARRGYV